jgi:nucleotide-binding universal stress UspA family protein
VMKNYQQSMWFANPGMIAEPESRKLDKNFYSPARTESPDQRNHPAVQRDNGRFAECADDVARRPVIFVPFVATTESLRAAKKCVISAQQSGARLVLFHAVHLNLSPYGPANPIWLKAALRQEAVEMAEPVMRFAQALGVSVICVVEEGPTTSAILTAAKKWEVDVIVLAAEQRGWLARWFERRRVDRVIRAAECPVLVMDERHR